MGWGCELFRLISCRLAWPECIVAGFAKYYILTYSKITALAHLVSNDN